MDRTEFDTIPLNERFRVQEKRTGDIYRAKRESADNVFVYAKGKSRYGYRYMTDMFLKDFEPIPKKDPEVVWQRKISGIIKRLEKSGLWPEFLEIFRNLQKMTWEDREAIKNIDWNLPYDPARTKDEYKTIYDKYWDKYPFLFDASGANHTYLYGVTDCKTKSMYFGRYNNERVKDRIKAGMEGGYRVVEYGRTSYDVSFEYDPARKKAWYSEEYKGCGNGHYYLALDGSCALFYEDD